MNHKELLTFAKEAAKSMEMEKDLRDFSRMLKKVSVEAALGAQLKLILLLSLPFHH